MKKVMLYTLSTCPWCRKAKIFFKEHKVDFDFIDYDLAADKDQQAILEEMKKLGGGNSFPLVKIGDEAVEGYDIEKFSQLLGI